MSFFNPLNLFNSPPPSEIDNLRKIVEKGAGSKNLDVHITEFFQEKSEQLLGELMTDPQKGKNWRKLGSRLKEIDPTLFKQFQSSIGAIQKVATLLRKDDTNELDFLTDSKKIGRDLPFSIAAHFHDLKLPEDLAQIRSISHPEVRIHLLANLINRDRVSLDELTLSKTELMAIAPYLTFPKDLEQIRSISHPEVRTHLLANLINRDQVSLDKLKLSKIELMAIAPHLTFVNCGNLFVREGQCADWTPQEIYTFLDKCKQAKILKIETSKLTRFPSLPECIELQCRCSALKRLSALPKCQTLNCSDCTALTQLPELANCKTLNCINCTALLQLPELANCKTLNCNFCTALTQIRGLANCQTLDCSNCTALTQIQGLANCRTLNCSNCSTLTQLPELANCQTLNCSNCTALLQLPELANCRTLNCNFCTALTQIRGLANCQTLDCSHCTALLQLPVLANCRTLECSFCTALIQIGGLANCQTLNCRYCIALTQLPELTNCKTLNCINCTALLQLPELANCQTLDCSSCKRLTQLQGLANCQTLNCSNCTALTQLPELANCQKLDCSDCTALTQLPELANCRMLKCNFCTAFTQLPELPNCQALFCQACTALTQIRGLANCQMLNCSYCTALTQLPELNQCNSLISYNTRNLSAIMIPQRFRSEQPQPADSRQHSSRQHSSVLSVLYVRVEELRQNPLKVLAEFGALLAEEQIPKVQFIEQNGQAAGGIDAGGLRRILISRLMQEISAHSQEPDQLPFDKEALGLLPFLSPDMEDIASKINGFTDLALLFVHCLNSEDVTGNVFHPEVFRRLASITFQDLADIESDSQRIPDELRLRLLAADPMHQLKEILKKFPDFITDDELLALIQIGKQSQVFDLNAAPDLDQSPLSNETKQWIHDAIQRKVMESSEHDFTRRMATLLLKPPETLTKEDLDMLIETGKHSVLFDEPDTPNLEENPLPLETKKWIHAKLKENFLETSIGHDTLLPAVLIAKQMQEQGATSKQWESWSILAALGGMQTKVEGVAGKEEVLAAIEWNKSHEALNEADFNKTKEYVESWIKAADSKDLQNILFVLTGAPALPSGKNLDFRFYDSGNPEKFPNVHTCSFQIDIPINYTSFEKFKEKWDTMIAQSINPEHSGVEEM